jgi:hypothetical protein
MATAEARDQLETVLAVRGLPLTRRDEHSRSREDQAERVSDLDLVLDTETRTDHTQRLLFGSARLYASDAYLAEWLYYPPDISLAELAVLEAFVQCHADDADGHIRLLPVADFLRRVFARVAYREHGRVIGFNLPFDLSRFALAWRPATDWFAGGFTLQLYEYIDETGTAHRDRYLPSLRVKAMGSKRQRIGFAGVQRGVVPYRGRFLDLHQFAYALTDRSYSLDGAAAAFGMPVRKAKTARHGVMTERYVEYNRQDVRTTYALYQALMSEWQQLPIA